MRKNGILGFLLLVTFGLAACIVETGPTNGSSFGGEPETAEAKKLRDTGLCHMANVTAQKVIYNGECNITQEATQYGVRIAIRMGTAEPWLVACQSDGSSCMHGPREVRMRDRGNGEASFRWQEEGQAFRLDVEAD